MPSRQGKEIGKSCAEVNYVFQVIFVLYKRRESRARVLTNFIILRKRVCFVPELYSGNQP